MIKIYFDNVLIDENSYANLENNYKLFTDNFYLGSTASNTFKLSVAKTAVTTQPSEVKITDDTNTYYLIIDKITDEKNFYIYDLVDKLVLFNFNYDASVLIADKLALEEATHLSDILADMCSQAGVTLDETLTLINDIEVTWYDNTLLARDYLSFIAELQGGYARILDNGKLTIVKHKMTSQSTLQIDSCEDFLLGEKKTISNVVYDDGINFYEYGDGTGNTLYLNPNNVYITDTTVVSNIYDEVVGLEFYLIDTGKCQLDPSVRAGDIITFTDGTNSYLTIAGYSANYGGGYWLGNYSLNIESKQQEETKVIGLEKQVKSIKTIVDRDNAKLTIVASKVTTAEEKIGEIDVAQAGTQTQLDDYIEDNDGVITGINSSVASLNIDVTGVTTTVNELKTTVKNGLEGLESRTAAVETTIDGIEQTIKYSGGYNLLENCVKQFGQAGWDGDFTNFTNTEIQQKSMTKSALNFMDDTETRAITVPNGKYNFSAKYKKLIDLADCNIIINGIEIDLTDFSGDFVDIEQNIEVTGNNIDLSFYSDTDNALWLVDVLLIPGDIKQTWTPNPNEIDTGVIKLGGSKISIENSTTNTRFEASPDGTRVFNKATNQPVATYTDKGIDTDDIVADSGTISKLLFTDIGDQTLITRI